jgi:hypothetical protein
LVEELDPRSELRVAVLELDGRPIAYHFGFQLDGKYVWYKPNFDINLWEESPGEVLLRNLFLYAKTAGVREFDFTVGDESFKRRFSNRTNQNLTIHVYPPGPRGHAARRLFLVKEQLKERRPFVQLLAARLKLAASSQRVRHFHDKPGVKALVAAFWKSFFAHDELLAFSVDLDHPLAQRPALRFDSDLRMGTATLADLAMCSLEHPAALDTPQLQIARNRIKRGDVPYLARSENKVVCLAWIGIRNEPVASDVGLDCCLPPGKPVAVIYDGWTPAGFPSQAYSKMLQMMAESASGQGFDAWTFCRSHNRGLRRAIEGAGFLMRQRIRRVRLAGLSRSWVRPAEFQDRHVMIEERWPVCSETKQDV